MLVILLGPSGSGKTTIEQCLERRHRIYRMRSHTTRARKKGEGHNAYYFVTREEFRRTPMVESVFYNGHFFGLSAQEVIKAQYGDCVVTMDQNGAEQMKRLFPACVTVFLDCPFYQLEKRLPLVLDKKKRDKVLAQLEADAKWAIECDYIVRNHDGELEEAVAAILRIFGRTQETQG